MKKVREKEKGGERDRESTPAGFAVGDRAWTTGSRAARDGIAARKKRERTRFGRRKKGEEKVKR